MKQKKVIVKREYILIDDNAILQNYWYKYVLYIIQGVLNEEESKLISSIGELAFEKFYDLIEEFSIEINGNEFNKLELPKEIEKISNQLEQSIVDKESFMYWDFDGVKYKISMNFIITWTDDYFRNLILPYLELEKNYEVEIESCLEKLKLFFEIQIKKNGFDCTSDVVNENSIIDINLIKKNSKFIKWFCDEEQFLIINDLYGYIPVEIKVTLKNKRSTEHIVNIFFPFYKKGDSVHIKINNTGLKWMIFAEHENSHVKYIREIEL